MLFPYERQNHIDSDILLSLCSSNGPDYIHNTKMDGRCETRGNLIGYGLLERRVKHVR